VIGRCEAAARRQVEANIDRRVLAWIARFRFVTAPLVAERFGVSVQKTHRRLARLQREGLLTRQRTTHSEQYAVSLTPAGAGLLDLPRRRAPRVHVQRDHELAIVWLASRIERTTDLRVLTERECRLLEVRDERRLSVDVERATGRGDRRRWPDLVLETDGRRTAVEIEFAPKGSERLAAIVDAYLQSVTFTDVRFLMSEPATARRLASIVAVESISTQTRDLFPVRGPHVVVAPWVAAGAAQRAAVQRAIDDAESLGA
jgi:DNA-binding MarR family transcriptional regulator